MEAHLERQGSESGEQRILYEIVRIWHGGGDVAGEISNGDKRLGGQSVHHMNVADEGICRDPGKQKLSFGMLEPPADRILQPEIRQCDLMLLQVTQLKRYQQHLTSRCSCGDRGSRV